MINHPTAAEIAARLKGVVLRRCGLALLLWGEPGIGKSHLLQSLLQQSSCRSFGFQANEAITNWIRGIPRPSGKTALPAWADPLLDKLQNGEAVEIKKTADALGALLAGLAPVVLYLEDLHEANPERLELIQTLAQMVSRSKVVALLATSRAAPLEGFEGYRLEPLSAEGSKALLEDEVNNNLPTEALEWIYGKAAGNPLFTLEYLRYLARQGALWNDGKRWRWREPPEQTMPLTVEALIEQQLTKAISHQAHRQTLSVLAVLGAETNLATVAAVAQCSEPQLQQNQAELQKLGILRGDWFAHPLYREVVLQEVSPLLRRDLARRALEAMAQDNLVAAVEFVADAQLSAEESLAWLKQAAEFQQASSNPA